MSNKDNLISIYKTPDELSGIAIRSLLNEEGIESILHSSQIPWYDSIMVSALGYWGEIFVREKDKKKAETIVEDFLKSTQGRN